MPFKTVLAKFRGRPGSVVLLSVVDGASALKSGQEPETIGVQRFATSQTASERRAAFQLPDGSGVPAPTTDKPQKTTSFAPIPRVEKDTHESGLCSPYSDPGNAVAEREPSQKPGATESLAKGDRLINTSGAISIDSLHTRLLERLFGGNMASASSTAGADADDSSISNLAPSVMLMTPTHEMSPAVASGRADGSKSGLPPGAALTATPSADEKFKCLEKLPTPTRVAQAIQSGKFKGKTTGTSASRDDEYGKRVRSPNADENSQPLVRSGKRMRHGQSRAAESSLYATAPSMQEKGGSLDPGSQLRRPSRATGPRKPAVPTFSHGRPSSAPKARPVLYHPSFHHTAQPQKQQGHKGPGATKIRVTVQAPSREKSLGSASPARTQKTASESHLQPADRKAVSRKRRSGQGRSGVRCGDLQHGTPQQGHDDSLIVYADVGRAVTSLVQRLSIVPDHHRYCRLPSVIPPLAHLFVFMTVLSRLVCHHQGARQTSYHRGPGQNHRRRRSKAR